MTKNIKFRISFINHLNETINLNDFITNIENGNLIYEINKGYLNLDFVTNGVYYDPLIIGDDIERIKVEWQIDDNDKQTELLCVEAVDYLKDNNIRVYCRSKSFKYAKYYINKIITGDSLVDLFSKIFDGNDVANDYTNLTDLTFKGSLVVENKTGFDLIEELRSVYKFEYYYRQGTIYFRDKKSIDKDDKAVASFSELDSIEDFVTSSELFKRRIKEIKINQIKNQNLENENQNNPMLSSLKLDIKPEPQPCSPDSVLSYTDDNGNTYKIPPVKGIFYVYYSPFAGYGHPTINQTVENKSKTMIETYELNNENSIRVMAHIADLNSVEGVDNYYYEHGGNLITFDKKYSGQVKISYSTNALVGTLESSKYPKETEIKINWLDRQIDFNHKYVLNGYYPTPYTLTLNTISDWGISADNGINQSIGISKYDKDSKAFVSNGNTTSDDFGDFKIDINDYGTYRFDMSGQEPLFLDYYVNKKEVYMNETNC